MARRGEEYYCGRCALRADWEQVARTVQGLVVRDEVTAPAPRVHAGCVGEPEPPADPFTR